MSANDGRAMPKPGKPTAEHCRHCRAPKVLVRGYLLCEKCDAPMDRSGATVRPTWKPTLR